MRTTLQTSLLLLLTILFLPLSATYAYTLQRVSVHDPSIVWEPDSRYYYIFGTHHGVARSRSLTSWTSVNWTWGRINDNGLVTGGVSNAAAFQNCATKTIMKNGVEVEFPNFNAHDWSAAYGGYSIEGNMWAPDVIYNKAMGKWCMYLSINGPKWNSSIILLTADRITGPYVYQAPVIISGFNIDGAPSLLDYHNTDMQLALGTLTSLPIRYRCFWGNRWPHCIDPCVFYDEEGKLWMSYGSWSGGIWMLELNEENGLRDYDVKYPSTSGNSDGVTSDPYFGKKIAGGFYASGEGSYVVFIGGYYYLFVTNGGLAAGGNPNDYNNGGYQMRVFRSMYPNGPYTDSAGRSAVLNNYELNFGPNSSHRGVNLFGAYGYWGDMLENEGERSQGHNSVINAPDGRTYLVYHTRFQNASDWFQNRVHQLYQNIDGWLVAAPFEYTGESTTNDDIMATQQIETTRIPGTYQLLIHNYGLDHRKKDFSTPIAITLHADGTISGEKSGTWYLTEQTSYISLSIGGILYKGVMTEQTMEPSQTKRVPAVTALAASGETVWGYRTGDDTTPLQIPKSEVATHSPLPSRTQHAIWHNLHGQRVYTPSHEGVYILNGQKVYVN